VGVGTFDVTEYYRSVDIELLPDRMPGAPRGAADALLLMLRALPECGGVSGLPIGFEGSALLGNVFLLPADVVLGKARVGLVRWTDDTWLFLRDDGHWAIAKAEYVGLLGDIGLKLNESKASFHERSWAPMVISNSTVDSIVSAAPRGRVDAREAHDRLLEELNSDEPEQAVISFTLSCLRSSPIAAAVGAVVNHPELWVLAPKTTGDLLLAIARDPILKRRIDVDWLVSIAQNPSGPPSAQAGRVHALRVCSHLHLNRDQGAKAFALATSGDENHAVVRSFGAVAWGSSDHWKPGRAAEAALEAGHLTLRRSFVAGFAQRPGQLKDKYTRRLSREEPELGPTLTWAAA
jgi:hypothetical protein